MGCTAPIPAACDSSLLPDTRTEGVRVSDVLAALSFALDLAEGQPAGHSLRTCLIGMELADGSTCRSRTAATSTTR